MNLEEIKNLTFYLVVNSDGQYFRRKGYCGSGDSWVKEIGKARVYSKINGARGVVTFFSNNPKYPIPKIVKMSVTAVEVIDETARVTAQKEKERRAAEESEVRETQRQIRELEVTLRNTRERLARAKDAKKK